MTPSRRLGLLVSSSTLLLQVPFTLLASNFDYPDILRRPAAEILARFTAGGPALILTWYAFAACVLPLGGALLALPRALGLDGERARLATVLAAASALSQLVGLLRWTLVVPVLARHADDPAVARVFEAQHQLFGVLLGEHVGQLTLALWTWLLSGAPALGRGARRLARAAAALMVLGLSDGLATVLALPAGTAALPLAAFALWTLTMLWASALLLRGRASAPA